MRIETLISQIQAIAQTGDHYTKDIYDKERYNQLKNILQNLIKELSNESDEKIDLFINSDCGYATPKVDIRAVVFNENGHLLMVQEKNDSSWSLPGGWADIEYSPSEVAIKEVEEEAGINIYVKQIIAVYDKARRNYKPSLEYVYKFFMLCEFLSGELKPGIETLDAKYISRTEIENINISLDRNSIDDINMIFDYYNNPNQKTLFD